MQKGKNYVLKFFFCFIETIVDVNRFLYFYSVVENAEVVFKLKFNIQKTQSKQETK